MIVDNQSDLFDEIDGYCVTVFADDGIAVKSELPDELFGKLYTKRSWFDKGRVPKSDATGYQLHPKIHSKKVYTYYLEKDTVKITDGDNFPKICCTCKYGTKRNYCTKKRITINNRVPFIPDRTVCYKCSDWEAAKRINRNWILFDEKDIQNYM